MDRPKTYANQREWPEDSEQTIETNNPVANIEMHLLIVFYWLDEI